MRSIRSSGAESFASCVRELMAVLRARVLVAVALIIAIMVTEGIGIVLLVPLLAVAGFGQDAPSGMLRQVAEILASVGVSMTLLPMLLAFLVASSGRAVLSHAQAVNVAILGETFLRHLRMRLYRAFVNARYEYLTQMRASDIVHALTEDMGRVRSIAYQLVNLSGQVVVTGLLVGMALLVSWQATLLALVAGTTLFATLWSRASRSQVVGESITDHGARLAGAASEHLAGIKIAKSHHVERVYEEAFRRFSDHVGQAGVEASRGYADVSMRFQIASACLACAVVYVSLAWLALPAGELLLLIVLFARLVPRFHAMQYGIQELLNALPAYGRIADLTAVAEAAAGAVRVSGAGLQPGAIAFEDVTFRYASQGHGRGIEGISFRAAPGEAVAIIGPSGAGKTTLADLLTGLLEPLAGHVRAGGRIAYVAQETFLFNDTVRANLSWARPMAADADLWRVLEAVHAADFVRHIPGGLEAVIGDRGVQLSGGERQRLALARALLMEPDILILDEATNALDLAIERELYDLLGSFKGKMTLIVISHSEPPAWIDRSLDVSSASERPIG